MEEFRGESGNFDIREEKKIRKLVGGRPERSW